MPKIGGRGAEQPCPQGAPSSSATGARRLRGDPGRPRGPDALVTAIAVTPLAVGAPGRYTHPGKP
ncbi:hypothetical protein ACFU6M_12450 [Streptomyces bottropensis]|uniref:hypothetical protein n=1 Tax=Streptomyces bottropensis TaxID=42235 RepID=UPI003690D862